MAVQKKITLFKRVAKMVKGKGVNKLEEVKTDGTKESVEAAVMELQKSGVHSFEITDPNLGLKTVYNKLLSGRNYEQKVLKI